MHLKTIVFAALGALALAPAASVAAPCCEDKACCTDMAACCRKTGDELAANVLVPQNAPEPPVRQVAVVWFMRPTIVGRSVLQGQYVIEHDQDRMARGLPCTHIYPASRPQVPVVKFHCTHLEREGTDRNTLVVHSTGDATVPARLQAFQFAGETAAHGVPRVR